MTAEQLRLKDERDYRNSIIAVREEGYKEGRNEAILEIVKDCKRNGIAIKTIAQWTDLSIEEINAIKLD